MAMTLMVAQNPARHIQTAIDEAIEILNCVWVITLERFVLIDNPKREWKVHQFDEAYAHIPLPARMKPSDYIRRENSEFRVVNHMEMAPDKPHPVYRDEDGFKVFNLYRGNAPFPEPVETDDAITPQTSAGPKTYLDHLSYIYGSPEKLDHALKWMAHLLYRPERRINHGLCLSGKQGTGKSTIAKVLTKLIGPAYRTITPALFTSDFQDWFMNIRLAIVEEIREYGGHSSYNKVKHYFTEDEIPINPKGKTMFNIKNHVHFMLFSNHHYPLPLEEGDRRIHYVESPALKQEPTYYDELYNYLDLDGAAAGVWAFGKYLKDKVLPAVPDNFATKPPPVTPEHIKSVQAAANPIEAFIDSRRAARKEFYAPRLIFDWSELKADLKNKDFGGDFGYILRNHHETMSVLARCNISREQHVIDKKKRDVCWFNDDKEFDAQVRHLFNDTSNEGRRELTRILYRHTEYGRAEDMEGYDAEQYKAAMQAGKPYSVPIKPYKYPDFDDLKK